MSCTNPQLMLAVSCKDLTELLLFKNYDYKVSFDDKKAYKFLSPDSRDIELEKIPDYISHKVIELPCGSCLSCRLLYSRDWAVRCSHEAEYSLHNYFITLTYDDEHLPRGELGNSTIVYEDFQKFIASLRRHIARKYEDADIDTHISYFGCFEYGDKTLRSHAHVILFNCPLDDLTLDFVQEDGSIIRQKNKLGDDYYYSDTIHKLWNKGNIMIAPCSYNTSAYVSRYVLKKQKGESAEIYEKLGVLPPKVFMSTRPSIGFRWFMDHVFELFDLPKIVLPREGKDTLVCGLPRFYKKLFKKLYPDIYRYMFTDRVASNIDSSRSLLKGHQSINDNRIIKEERMKSQFSAFGRDKI